ncbi:hypothetical protein PRNP1_006389 [Phytophthora ramorum]
MAALIDDSGLYEPLGGNKQYQKEGAVVHLSDDEDGLERSYVCSMSSAVDLEGQAGGSCADLARSVQCYLARIVEELHLISAWSSTIYQHQQRATTSPVPIEDGRKAGDSSFTAMARLAVVTDIELMRRDVAKTQHELFQRCTTQMAYMQCEASAQLSKQDTLYNELKERLDDKQRPCDQLAQSVQTLEKAQAESDAQVRALTAKLRQVQQQTAAHPARITALEKSLGPVTTTQFSHEQELQTLHRRVESNETAHHLQLEATRRAVDDSLAGLRSAHSQLSAKMQVLRLELQELSDSTQKRLQQFLKSVGYVVGSVTGKSPTLSATSVAPRRPSVASPRSGGNTATTPTSQSAEPGISSDTLDGILTRVTTSDCFIYAKAALPHRASIADTSTTTNKPVAPSTASSRALSSHGGASSTHASASDMKFQDTMTNLLKVQQSVMSLPLGCEEAVRPAISTEVPAKARPDPIIPTKRGTHRHNSLPDGNLSVAQGALSPRKSRLHTKLQ